MMLCNVNLTNLASSYICSDYTMIERIRTIHDIGLLVVIDRKLKSNLIVESLFLRKDSDLNTSLRLLKLTFKN